MQIANEAGQNLVAKELAEIRSQWQSQRIHEVDFHGFAHLGRRMQQIMDVGANRGQSIASIRVLLPTVEIHSFEANPLLHPVLNELASSVVPPPVFIHAYGLSDTAGQLPLFIPCAGGEVYLEGASTRADYFKQPWVADMYQRLAGSAPGGITFKEVSCELKVGDDLQLSPDLIKVDVEGAESRVLIGLTNTIKRCRPVIMVENGDWHGVQAVLVPLGYSPFLYHPEQNRFAPFTSGSATNTFYFPEAHGPG